MIFPVTLTSVLFSVAIILLSCLIMARYRDLFKRVKIPLAIIVMLGGLTVYTIGYLPPELTNGESYGLDRFVDFGSVILRALFSSCRAFILESDFSEIHESLKSNGLYVLAFNTVLVLATFFTVLTVLSLLGVRFIARMQLLIARDEEVYVFLGLHEASYHMIRDLRKNGKNRTIIVVENIPNDQDEDDNTLITRIRENQCILIDQDAEDISLRKLGLPKRFYKKRLSFFILFDQDSKNAKTGVSVIEQIGKAKVPQGYVTLYIQTLSGEINRILDKAMKENHVAVEVKTFSVPDLTARQLMESHPVYETIALDTGKAMAASDFAMLIAGFGQTGEEVLRKAIYSGQFIGSHFKAVVVDQSMSSKIGVFYNRYPGLRSNYDISFNEAHTGSEAFYDLLIQYGPSLNYIVICLGDDKTNLETALEIQRMIQRKLINQNALVAVHVLMRHEFAHLMDSEEFANIRFFGCMDDIYSESIIINESMDRMARKMNAMFNEIYHVEPADNWGTLDAFTKESNRSAAMNIRTKLRLLGLSMAEKGKTDQKPVRLDAYLEGVRLDNLAQQEHLRWNAFHFASGWVTWELHETGQATRAKDLKSKRHACLVSWQDLKAVTARFNQKPSYEELDYEQVRHIPEILEYAGYEVYENDR